MAQMTCALRTRRTLSKITVGMVKYIAGPNLSYFVVSCAVSLRSNNELSNISRKTEDINWGYSYILCILSLKDMALLRRSCTPKSGLKYKTELNINFYFSSFSCLGFFFWSEVTGFGALYEN